MEYYSVPYTLDYTNAFRKIHTMTSVDTQCHVTYKEVQID